MREYLQVVAPKQFIEILCSLVAVHLLLLRGEELHALKRVLADPLEERATLCLFYFLKLVFVCHSNRNVCLLRLGLTVRRLHHPDNVLFAVSPHAPLADAYGGEDALFIPRAERVGVYLEQLARLLERDEPSHFIVIFLWFLHIASHPTFDNIILQHRVLVSKITRCGRSPFYYDY